MVQLQGMGACRNEDGNGISNYQHTDTTYDDCASICLADANCIGLSWMSTNRRCHMHTTTDPGAGSRGETRIRSLDPRPRLCPCLLTRAH